VHPLYGRRMVRVIAKRPLTQRAKRQRDMMNNS
jgi:hypothetical protein